MWPFEKLGHYLTKLAEFATDQPRKGNTEGEIFPAIFGTVLMVLIYEFKTEYMILIVTYNVQQAARVSDHTAFMYLGDLIELEEDQSVVHPRGDRPRTTSLAYG